MHIHTYIHLYLHTQQTGNYLKLTQNATLDPVETQDPIYHRVNCKNSFVIYLLECYIRNIQFVGKAGTTFNIRLNNHKKDAKNRNAMPACKHFNRHYHDFNNLGKIIIIEQLRNIRTTSTETLKERLKQRENFWIMKLETLAPHGLKQDLN